MTNTCKHTNTTILFGGTAHLRYKWLWCETCGAIRKDKLKPRLGFWRVSANDTNDIDMWDFGKWKSPTNLTKKITCNTENKD